jgi:hypothetical protein
VARSVLFLLSSTHDCLQFSAALLFMKSWTALSSHEDIPNLVHCRGLTVCEILLVGAFTARIPGSGTACQQMRQSLRPNVWAQVVKAPGNLVISAYVGCPDITLTVTPDLKLPGSGRLLWVDLSGGRKRLGGSALAHAYGQVQHACPCRVLLVIGISIARSENTRGTSSFGPLTAKRFCAACTLSVHSGMDCCSLHARL